MSGILTYLRPFRQLAGASESDGVLLQRFRLQRDEQAFATLVHRHGPLVLGIARRALGSVDAADDVFQATFLVLAQRGKKLETWPSVAGWLVQVARRTALQARSNATRRARHEQQAATMTSPTVNTDPSQTTEQQVLSEILDEELARLPSKYRTPLILCQLQGQTREETARQLGWPVGSVSGRLARCKKLLKERLLRRGVIPSIVAGGFSIPRLEAQASGLLIQATTLLASNVVHQTSKVSAGAAVTLAQGVMTSMLVTKLKYAAVVIVTLCLCLGTGVWAWTGKDDPTIAQPASSKGDSKKTLFEQIQGVWMMDQAELTGNSNETIARLLQLYWRFDKDDLVTYQQSADIKHWPFQIDESYAPASIELKTLMNTADIYGTINLHNDRLYLTLGQRNTRVNCSVVLRRVTDYDRLAGVWRREERNPVTNELTEVNELIFRNNFYIRRRYTPVRGITMGLSPDDARALDFSQEYAPSKFELHESLNPKGIDLDIRDENYYRTSQPGLFQDTSKLNQRILIERQLGIYQLTDNEFKYAITGRVPIVVQGDSLIPNMKSPVAVRGTTFDKIDAPLQIYKRVTKSLKDEVSANGRIAYPQQVTKEQPMPAQVPASPKLQSLLLQRLKVAEERMNLWKENDAKREEKLKKAPSTKPLERITDDLGPISQQLLEARLALASDLAAKVKAMEEHLLVLKQIEQSFEKRSKQEAERDTSNIPSGLIRSFRDGYLHSQLRRIEFEIQLEEMKARR